VRWAGPQLDVVNGLRERQALLYVAFGCQQQITRMVMTASVI
jgi:hypothetical protein